MVSCITHSGVISTIQRHAYHGLKPVAIVVKVRWALGIVHSKIILCAKHQ
jgi:hypothetical protein